MPKKREESRTAYQRRRILEALAENFLTAQQLADKLHMSRDGINLYLKAMKEAEPREIHVHEWLYNSSGGRPAPQYGLGDLKDATYIHSRAPTRHLKTSEHKKAAARFLSARKLTIMQLSDELGLSHQWTRSIVRELRQCGRVHIAGWQRQSAGIAPQYAIGNNKPDVPKPAIDPKERHQRIMQKIKTDPEARERYEAMLARRRMRNHLASFRSKPQNPFSALGL